MVASVGDRQRHFDMAEWRGEKFGQFEVDGSPLNVAEDVSPGFIRTHATGVRVVPATADRHRDAVQDGHVLLVTVEHLQPVGQFMPGQIYLEGLLFLVLLQLFGREGRQSELFGQVAVRFTNKDESVQIATRGICWCAQEVVERRRKRQAGSPQGGRLQKFSSTDLHRLFPGVAFAVDKRVG